MSVIVRAALAVLALATVAACNNGEANRGVSAAWLDAMLVQRDYERYPELFATSARVNGSTFGGRYLKSIADGLHAAFPDLTLEVEEQLTDRDRVVTRFRLRGTHTGVFNTLPPTHREVAIRGVAIDRIEDGRVADTWLQLDLWGLGQQLAASR
jgi:predicted ester cyclase